MAKQLTNTQVKDYLKDTNCCPFCKSDSLTTGYTDYTFNMASRYIKCNDCNENFFEIFKMITIAQAEFEEVITEEVENYIIVEQQCISEGIWNENNIYIKDNGD